MIQPWIKYSFFTKVVTCEKCGARELITPTSAKYVDGQIKVFAKHHQHEQLSKPSTS